MRKVILLLLLLSLFTVPTFAGTIDLTNFAAGDSTTHSHVYVEKYDATHHWQECTLCGGGTAKTEHTLSTSYTIGENSCSSANYKETSCSGCSYLSRVKSQKAHTPAGAYQISYPMVEGKMQIGYTQRCSGCNVLQAGVRCRDINGKIIDIYNDPLPVDCYTEDGEFCFVWARKFMENNLFDNSFFSNIEYEFLNNNTQMKVSLDFDIPDSTLDAVGEDKILSAAAANVLTYYLGAAGDQVNYYINTESYAAENQVLSLSQTFDIQDLTQKKTAKPYFCVDLYFHDWNAEGTASESYRYVTEYTYIDLSQLVAAPTLNAVIN